MLFIDNYKFFKSQEKKLLFCEHFMNNVKYIRTRISIIGKVVKDVNTLNELSTKPLEAFEPHINTCVTLTY